MSVQRVNWPGGLLYLYGGEDWGVDPGKNSVDVYPLDEKAFRPFTWHRPEWMRFA